MTIRCFLLLHALALACVLAAPSASAQEQWLKIKNPKAPVVIRLTEDVARKDDVRCKAEDFGLVS